MPRVIVIEFPDTSTEDVAQFVNELAEGLDAGEYGCVVTEANPVLAAAITEQLKTQRQQAQEGATRSGSFTN